MSDPDLEKRVTKIEQWISDHEAAEAAERERDRELGAELAKKTNSYYREQFPGLAAKGNFRDA